MAIPWGQVANVALQVGGSMLGGGETDAMKADRRNARTADAQTQLALPRDFEFTGPGGSSGFFRQTEGEVQRDHLGNAVPGITSSSGQPLVVDPDGNLRFQGSGKRFRGNQVINQAGQPVALQREGKFTGEFSLGEGAPTTEAGVQAGDLTGIREQFRQLAGGLDPSQLGNVSVEGVTAAADEARLFEEAGLDLDFIEGAQSASRDMLDASGSFLETATGPDRLGSLFSGFEGAAQGALADLEGGFAGAEERRLQLLRERAAPQETRALDDLQARLQAQGRFGSTGGNRAFESFATGLSRADLDRQLAAQDLGLRATDSARGVASTTGAIANQLAGTSSAIRRDAAGTAQDLARTGTGLNFAAGDQLRDIGADRFARALDVLEAITGTQQFNVDMASRGLEEVQGIDRNLLDLFRMGSGAERNRQQGLLNVSGRGPVAPAESGGGGLAGLFQEFIGSFVDEGGFSNFDFRSNKPATTATKRSPAGATTAARGSANNLPV